jgi:nucleoside-diphosphate-sugar epimerase
LNDVIEAARGTELIVHAANPPNYKNWRGLALPMLDNSIAAAKFCNARVLLPATLYNFSREAHLLRENSPQIPNTRKGQVRVEMELRLQRASLYGVRSIVVRAGDFFGPGARNSWLTRGVVLSRPRMIFNPGSAGVGHSWAYLPDLAEAMVRLIESARPMSDYEVFHFRGHWFERGEKLLELICRSQGMDTRRVRAFPWWAIALAAPFVDVCREMLEMRYLWQVPTQLDNAKLRAQIGPEPHTPIEEALDATLGGARNETAVESRIPA